MTKVVVRSDKNGNLLLPREILGDLGPETLFNVEREGTTIRLEITPGQPRIHEIQDPQARLRAFDALVSRVARKTGASWPENYNVRDDVYEGAKS